MKNISKTLLLGMIVIAVALSCQGQATPPPQGLDSLQKVAILKERYRRDSILKIMLRDSLGLSDQTISQIFTAKENFTSQSEQIRQNGSLSLTQKANSLHTLLLQTDAAVKELMGSAVYKRYAEVMARKEY